MADKMNKNDLKDLMKPIIKECMREVLLEEGLVKTQPAQATAVKKFQEQVVRPSLNESKKAPINEARRKIEEEVKNSRFLPKKFDPFAGSTPIILEESEVRAQTPGVDISSLIGNSVNILNAIDGKKG
jgi:hypothetical protein